MPGTNRPSLHADVVRRLESENEALRLKIATHEFRQMERELTSDDPFRLDVHVGACGVPNDILPPTVWNVALPRLPVPSGTIEAGKLPAEAPAIAVYDDGLTEGRLAAALLGLFKTQYRAPFARLVFLCSSFDAVPFLARYGFVAEQIGGADPASALGRLHRRYGVRQIRSVATGAVIAERDGA